MGAPDAVLELIERFERNRDQYLNPAYNETQVRREFIDPFFKALGWDVDNRAGYAQQYKDVVHEDAIKVGLDARAPDYSFRIGGQRKFFVEAKKPAVNLKDDPAPAFQLRRYAWSAKLPLCVLTDFQEFAVYDCRVKPRPADKPSMARTLYVPYEQLRRRAGTRSPRSSARRRSSRAPSTGTPSRRRRRRAPPRSTRPSSARSSAGATRWPATSPCATRRSASASSTSPCR